MTVAATAVAWISFGGVGDSLNRIVKDNIPTVVLAARLAEKGGIITATAPILAATTSEKERADAWSTLAANIKEMAVLLNEAGTLRGEPEAHAKLTNLTSALEANLRSLDTNVRRRFWFGEQNEDLVNRLRWAHADFLDEVEPMIEDARFKIGLAVERQGQSPAEQQNQDTLQIETKRQAALLRLSATGNLAVGLIARAASLSDEKALTDTALFLTEVQGRIRSDIDQLKGLPETLSLQQSLQDLMAFADGQNSLFQLRRDELKSLSEGQRLVAVNRELVEALQKHITDRVETGNTVSQQAAHQSGESIRRGKFLLIAAAGFSLVVAILVVWLYVGRNLVRRITALDDSMRAIADGNLDTDVPTGGTDEISEMAVALKTFRDTLAETQAELIQAGKLAALGQLAAGVAHELNQPLAAIRSYAHNASRLIDKDDINGAAGTLGRISNLVERMGGTVSHLRTLARRPSPELEPVDLAKVTSNALKLLEGRIRDEQIEVSNELTAGLMVNAEAIRLEQVLINVFGNAIDALAENDKGQIHVSAEPSENKIALVLRDTGAGVPEEDLEHIFDPFFTTKDQGEGLGLGLAISFNIIKDFGGSMRVASELGQGTVFRISLEKARSVGT